MKNSLLRTFFEWALITSVLMSVGFFCWYYYTSHAARATGYRLAQVQAVVQGHLEGNHTFMGMLLADCRAYGKTNADMYRLLESGKPQAQQAPAVPAAPAPATKPRTK